MFGLDIGAILATALTAFIPAGIDIMKGAANKWLGTPMMQPSNFQEYLQLHDADIKRLEALAKLDAPVGTMSRWVANLRGAIRYIIALLVLSVWSITAIVSIWIPVENRVLAFIGTMASAVMFFLFGEKVNMVMQPKR